MIKRTPPKSNAEPISHHSSEPDLTTPKSDLTMDRITQRQKRKHDYDQSSQFESFREEILSSFALLRKEQTEKFRVLQNNLEHIKAQNTELQSTVEFLSNKYDDLMSKLRHLEDERKGTLSYIRELEEKVDNLERNSRSSSLEIRNVPKKPGETKIDLISIVQTIGTAVKTEIQANELKDIYRYNNIRNPQAYGPITVEFTSNITKDKLLTSVKKYNREHKTNRLNSSHIKMEGSTPIFVSESLTSKTKKLYYQAREYVKVNGYAFHWTSHGKVYIKKKDGAQARRINQESDFEALSEKGK